MSMEYTELSTLENLYESNTQFYRDLMGLNDDVELSEWDIEFLEKITNHEFNK